MANTKGTSVINNPSGGGAQSGLGEKFSPDLFTGTGNFSVPIAVPPGRNGFQPELTLGYSSGNGNGVFGMGWALGVPGVMRKTSKGIPVYSNLEDIFILSGAEDLVPISIVNTILPGNIGYEKTTYQPRTEGLFARIIRHKKTNGEHYWEVRSKDGLISWYGTPGASTSSANMDTAVIANPEIRESIFAWHLTKTEDPFGNVILYNYTRDLVVDVKGRSYDQVYLDKIQYCQYPDGGDTKYLCEIRFVYEDRPDPFSAYKQGFEVRTTQRCTKIETYTNAASLIKTKTYHFNYPTALPLNGATLLDSVEVEGHNGDESEFMPPLKFGYSIFDPVKRELQEIKGPIPVNSLSEPGFELVDLDGNGLPDLLQLNGIARYWTNKGNGKFSPPRDLNIAPSVQLGMPGVQFMDANGDGRTDLLVNNGIISGYYPGAFHKVWDTNGFRPYTKIPPFSFADPEVQLIDLDGDGVTDVLRNGAKFECFYNNPEKGFDKVRTAIKTFADFSFADPRIRFADMTGDGLQDIVLISSGRVHYWPNMGYGRFGQKINMKNAPLFPEQYNPSQVLLGDLDGDGQADIAFVENNTVTLYINQSGNSFSAPVKIGNTPRVINPKALRIIDINGTGQAGLLWSFGPDAGTPGKMFFLDFTKGNKPYVMQEMNNNMGSLTRVVYGSSVYHYLRDQLQPATRWKTDLPFPVQVVNRVEVYDFLSGGKLVTEYNYHNGYWDGMEREFRGFAHVDSTDTETFQKFNVQDLFKDETVNTVSPQHYTPPVQTKSWFYVGPVGDSFSRWHEPDFSDEYWNGDANILQRPPDMITFLNSLPRPARRSALRTLRGTLLRSELYALDGSSLESRPYTVTESMMSLRKEFDPSQLPSAYTSIANGISQSQPQFFYVFFPFNIAERTTQYERGSDPLHNFSFTKDYDAYGQAQGQLSVGVPRNFSPAAGIAIYTGPSNTPPVNYLATFSFADYIDDTQATVYIKNREKRTRSWDATQSCTNKTIFDLRDDVFANYTSLPIIGCTLNFYDGLAFAGMTFGQMDVYGAQVRSETLIITDDIITAAYPSTPQCFVANPPGPDWNTGYPAAFAGLLQNSDDRLGYKDRTNGYPDHEPGWYAESARLMYDFQVTTPSPLPPEEQLGRMFESRDVFDSFSSIDYDPYLLMPITSTQYLYPYGGSGNSLITTADYDYRIMQPYEVKDVNDNYSEFDFSPLGLLRATALIGKGTEGDYITNSGGFYDRYAPSALMEYDFFAFVNAGDPVWIKTTNREQHYQQSAISPTIVKVEYSDGFGRLLQTRVQAENVIFGNSTFGSSGLPADQSASNADAVGTERDVSDPLNVVVSGWKIYNNKGKVVEQYEPFFDKGFDFVLPDILGVKLKMFFDPLGRVVKTINPDNSQQWVIYAIPNLLNTPVDPVILNGIETPSPWISFTYDANDLASVSNVTSTNVPNSHYFTPKSSEIDPFGRIIKTVEYFDNGGGTFVYGDTIEMNYQYDIRGNLLLILDPYNRNVFEHIYDLRGPQKDQPVPPIWTRHIDKGESTVLFDVQGKPIKSNDAKGALALSTYDAISRPNYIWANDNLGEATTLRQFLFFGDSLPGTPEVDNLKGRLFHHYDEAGLVEIPSYDFKGNILEKTRQIISDAEILSVFGGPTVSCYRVDWTGVPSSPPNILDTTIYETSMRYDALNRIIIITYPEDIDGLPRKVLTPTYNTASALEKIDFDGIEYVSNIAYNAKGQRLLIAYGNGIMCRYVYDSLTFRLLRQRSESFTEAGWTYTGTGNVKQDTAYEFDLVGNIIATHEATTGCGVGGTNNLDRDFDYDAIYRLLSANGRENAPTITPIWDDSYRSTNDNITTAYTQDYSYDKLGNIQSFQHTGNTSFTRTFNYTGTSNKLDSVDIGATNYAFSYDSCANQLTETSSRFWEYDASNKPRCFYVKASSSITQYTHYLYNNEGKRVKKLTWKTGGLYDSISYIDGFYEYRSDGTDTQNILHIMDNRSRISTLRLGNSFGDSTPATKYNLEDNLGSSVLQLEDDGTNINKEEYYPFGETSFGSYAKKRYKYCGKERDEESGLYYYGARYYSAWICRFTSIDPLAHKYPDLTPFQYAGNRPINFVDLDGLESEGNSQKPAAVTTQGVTATGSTSIITGTSMESSAPPTLAATTYGVTINTGIGASYALPEGPVSDAAHMADNVYGGPDATKLTGGWEISNKMTELSLNGVQFEDRKTGFKSTLYERTNKNGDKEYAYSTAGTDNFPDVVEDVSQALGKNSPQYKQSVANAKLISEKLGSTSLIFVGHSLGGGMASANAMATGRSAITFNAAGLDKNTIADNDLYLKAKIDAYIVQGEIVDYSQSLLGLKAAGIPHYLDASYVPQMEGTRADDNYRLYQRGMNHTMGVVMQKLQQQGIK